MDLVQVCGGRWGAIRHRRRRKRCDLGLSQFVIVDLQVLDLSIEELRGLPGPSDDDVLSVVLQVVGEGCGRIVQDSVNIEVCGIGSFIEGQDHVRPLVGINRRVGKEFI